MSRIVNIALAGACFLPLASFGFIEGYVSKGCTPGTWTEDVGKSVGEEGSARWYANKKGRFFIWVIEAEGGCAYCSAAASRIWNTAELKGWAKDNDIPMVVGNYSKMTYAASEFISTYKAEGMGAPVMAIVDGADGKTILGYSSVRSGTATIGMGVKTATFGGEGFLIDYMNGYLPEDIAKYYINKADDTPNSVLPNSTIPYYGTRAHAITPSKQSAKNPQIVGLWKDWEKNSLNSKAYLTSSGDVHVQSDDRQDWYKFTSDKSGQGYVVKCPSLSDKKALGWFVVCTNSATAKKVCTATTEKEMKKYSHFTNQMSSMKSDSGVSFVVPKKGTVYLAFWRRPAKAKENITLNYTFTIQEGVIDAFYFAKDSETYLEYCDTNTVHAAAKLGDWVTNDCSFVVNRANSGTKAEVAVQFDAGSARRNTDYIIESDSKIVTAKFESDKKSTLVPFRIISQKGLWKGDRSFTATITKSGKEGGITVLTNTIAEVDQQLDAYEPGSAGEAKNEMQVGVSTNRLNASDTKDWFKLLKPDERDFVRVSIRKLAASDENVSLTYGFYDGEKWKTNDISSASFDIPPAWYGKEVLYLKVARNQEERDDISCLYELKLETAERPVVKFENADEYTLAFDSPRVDTNVTFELVIPDAWTYKPLPKIEAENIAATNGLDYVFLNGSVSSNQVAVTLKNNASAWRPERSFKLMLSSDENGFYYIPEDCSSVTVTLRADPSDPPESVELTENSPAEPVGKELEYRDNRNVSNTNTSDAVYFYVTNGVDYVLAATDVLVKPVDADQDITVTMYTNLSSVSVNVISNETYDLKANGYSLTSTTNVWFEFKDMKYTWVSNTVSEVTNYFEFTESSSITNYWVTSTNSVDGSAIPNASPVTNFWSVGSLVTNYFTVTEITTNIATRTQRKPEWTSETVGHYVVTNNYGAELSIAPTNTSVDVTITNDCSWVEYGKWTLSDIADPDKMPLLNFLETGDIKVKVSREPNDSVLAEYSLALSQWQTTTVQFAEAAWTNMQNEAETLLYKLERSGDTKFESTVYVSLECGTARNGVDVSEFKEAPVVFGAGEQEACIAVTNLMAATPNVWKGDREFKLALAVKDPKLTLGAVSNATVVLKSDIPEYEVGDSPDEKSSCPGRTNSLAAAWSNFERTMNGADGKDCFLFTNVVGGVRYRFRLETVNGSTNHICGVETTFYTNEVFNVAATNLTDWAEILNSDFDFTPAEGVTNITVKLCRQSDGDPASISMQYKLMAREWPWPTFGFAIDKIECTDKEDREIELVVERTNNNEISNKVEVTFATIANSAVGDFSPNSTQQLVFAPNETNKTLNVKVSAGENGVWTGDWAFTATLKQVKGDESKLGAITNMTVIVKDADSEFDARDELGDDSYEAVLTNQLAQLTMESYAQKIGATLHGSDNCDWYCFTNVVSNALYYVAAKIGEKTANVVSRNFKVECCQYQGGTTNVVDLKNDMFTAASAEPILVKVWYEGSSSSDVRSLPYELVYRKVDAYVYLGSSEKTVEESAPGFYLDVICVAGTTKLSAAINATVTPVVLEGDAASSPEDFDGRPIKTGWSEGVTGVLTNRVFIPLTNYDTRWEGDETFHVELTVGEGAGLGETVLTKVTIVESDSATPGTVAITGAGDPLKKITGSLVLSAREDDNVKVRLTRKDGIAGDIVTRWYWKDEDNTTVKYESNYTYYYATNFTGGVDGSAEFLIPVPKKAGYQSSQKWTLKMKMASDCKAKIASDSPESIKFKVVDAEYGGKISTYSDMDPTRVRFSGSKWFTGADGDSVRSTHPDDGKSVTMSATVTGPGVLVFDANLEEVTKGYLKVTGGLEELKLTESSVSNRVEIAPGDRKLKFVFQRSKKDSPIAAVSISNVTFEPAEDFNAYGTFTGPVEVDDIVGPATLSVASSGKASGKLSVGKTWSFSNKSGWDTNDWTMSVTAKCGSKECSLFVTNDLAAASVILTNEVSTNEVYVSAPLMMRDVWNDKPLSADAAALIGKLQGTHRFTIDDEAVELSVSEKGSVKIVGKINGEKVSLSRTLWMIDDNKGRVWVNGYVYLQLSRDGENIKAELEE